MFGQRPSSSDFGLYGQLTQLVGFDPTPRNIAYKNSPRTISWVNIMSDLSGLHDSGGIGEFFGEVYVVVKLTLFISLTEALIILPAHIAHSNALIKKKRILPLSGKLHVKKDDLVKSDQIVASANIPGNVQMLNVSNKLNIKFFANENQNLLVNGQKSFLYQAFDNIIMNAASFSPSGGIIEIVLSSTENYLSVSISDEGPGFKDPNI